MRENPICAALVLRLVLWVQMAPRVPVLFPSALIAACIDVALMKKCVPALLFPAYLFVLVCMCVCMCMCARACAHSGNGAVLGESAFWE